MENWFFTVMLILHVLGATIIIGIAFVTFVIEIKKFSSGQIQTLSEYIWRIAGITILVQLITGLYLANVEWDKISNLPYFWIKMFLFFVIGGIVGYISHKRAAEIKSGKREKTYGTHWTLISFLTFAIIAALGVMVAEHAS